MAKIKYYPISTKHKITQFPPPDENLYDSKEDAADRWGWCEDLFIGEIDTETDSFILRDIPEEFKPVLSGMAWESGHAYGQDEVRNHLESLVSDLLPAIRAFEKRLRNK